MAAANKRQMEEDAKNATKIALSDILPFCENNLCLTPSGRRSEMFEEVAFGDERRAKSVSLSAQGEEDQGDQRSQIPEMSLDEPQASIEVKSRFGEQPQQQRERTELLSQSDIE